MSNFNDNLKAMYPDIMRVAMKLTRYDKDAEELVQKAFLRALEKQSLFKGGNQTGWVVTIMNNIFNDEYRKNKMAVEIQGEEGRILKDTKRGNQIKTDRVVSIQDLIRDDDSSDDQNNPFDNINSDKRNKEYIYLNESETSSEYKGVNEALNQIGAKCKEILLLISEEYKYKEISDRLGIPMGTVMNRLLRCRKQLHQDLYGMSEYNEI
jgi:RNA polymerase sigma-70 factor (ECF subfamily)